MGRAGGGGETTKQSTRSGVLDEASTRPGWGRHEGGDEGEGENKCQGKVSLRPDAT